MHVCLLLSCGSFECSRSNLSRAVLVLLVLAYLLLFTWKPDERHAHLESALNDPR